jgi:GTP-binding protein
VLRKALEKNLPVILVINKVDRPDSRIPEVVDEAYGLFMDLDANDDQIEFPVVYASAKAGRASMNRPENGAMPDRENLDALFEVIFNTIPAPVYHEGAPLQAHVTNLDSSPYLGRLALCRIREGVIKKGENVMWMKTDGTSERVKISELLITDGLERVPAQEAGPGDIVAIAGIETITLGETLADLEKPHALPLIIVDEPSISMTIGINTSPIAGQEGKLLTARQVKNRLDAELIGNVSLRVLNTERPDTWEVQGRGELQLAVLVEIMRREGFELTVGKPQVVVKTVDGKLQEPMERLSIDIPDDYLGVVTQLMALRKGRMEQMVNHGTGWIRMDYKVPSRGLIGFRTEFLTETRGTGLLHHVFDGYENWNGEIRTRLSGSLVADRRGTVTAYAVDGVQERGVIFLEVGTEVYEGMIVGENSRTEDMDVNIVREKKLTNMRSSGADDANRIIPPRLLNLEQALEFCREDECVEVTPKHVRVRKTILDQNERARNVGRAKKVNLNAE